MDRSEFESKDLEFDLDYMKKYINIPAKQKLQFLEESYLFFYNVMPEEKRKLSEKLKHLRLEDL